MKKRDAAADKAGHAYTKSLKSPYDGTNRIRFSGYDLSQPVILRQAPLFFGYKYNQIF